MADGGTGYRFDPGPGPATWVDVEVWDEADLPPRPWIAKGYLMEGAVTLIVGAGGASKSSLVLAYATVMALGKEFHGFKPVGTLRSVVYNIEDDKTEQRRRLSAIGTSLGRRPEDFAKMIARTGPDQTGLLFCRAETGRLVPTAAMIELEELVVYHNAKVLFVDPLAELHAEDENDNNGMRAIIAAFRQMAERLKIAVGVIHHTRKGLLTPGDADVSRGAGAIIGASRIVLTVVGMSEEEEKAFGLPTKARRHFFRLDGAKANYSALTDCEWFEKVSYTLMPSDEQVAVPVPWTPPVDVITPEARAKIEAAIERGSTTGPWSPKIENRPRSIKHVMVEVGITTRKGQQALLDALAIDNFLPQKFRDSHRKSALGLRAPNGKPDRFEWQDKDNEPTGA